jgi:hypothetical protein
MVSAVAYLKPIAEKRMLQSRVSGSHDPGIGLVLALVQLLGKAQEKINLFSSRHRDFYYRDVLLMKPLPPVPDSTFLVFEISPGSLRLEIPANTAFTAGKLDGKGEAIYETSSGLIATDARIQRLLTLSSLRKPKSSLEGTLSFISGVRYADIFPDTGAGGAGAAVNSWPIFGGTDSALGMSGGLDAETGFALATSALRLTEGERKIIVTITFLLPVVAQNDQTPFRDQFRSLILDHRRINDFLDGFIQQLDRVKSRLEVFENDFIPLSLNPPLTRLTVQVDEFRDKVVAFRRSIVQYKDQIDPTQIGTLKSQMDATAAEVDAAARKLKDKGKWGQIVKQFPSVNDEIRTFKRDVESWKQQIDLFWTSAAIVKKRLDRFIEDAKKIRIGEKHTREKEASLWNEESLVQQDPEYIFHFLLRNAFQCDITVDQGWHAFPSYNVSMPSGDSPGEYKIAFCFTLGAEVNPVVPHKAAIHRGGFEDDLPVLRFRMNPGSSVFVYSLLDEMTVRGIAINSEVCDAARILAWNQFGQLDTSKPFAPFGPLPTTNSYLVVGNYDAAAMNLTELEVNIEWGELPTAAGGFGEYYRGYGTTYKNDSFLVRLAVLRDGRWRPTAHETAARTELFGGHHSGAVQSSTRLDLDLMHWFKPIEPSVAQSQFRFDQKARAGFFKVELAAPDSAFGHRDYPYLITAAVTENARRRLFSSGPRTMPNPPYTPTINRISFSYKAESLIHAGKSLPAVPFEDRVYTVHPFGIETADRSRSWKLLPNIDFDGNLLIGLSASNLAGEITLLFHLREDSVTSISSDVEPVIWWYLASNDWRKLDQSRIVLDTTNGFLSSGIVKLNLPGDIDRNNSIMPSGLFWLRVSVKRVSPSFCSLYSIRAQAVAAVRTLTEAAPNVLRDPLPPGSIKGPVISIPGLRSVQQPIASRDGQQMETARQLITRTAERLRHKGRAVTPWDYERLVLDAFPDVFKVKCFAAMTSKGELQPEPGSVLIVVVPFQPKHSAAPVFDPMLNANRLKEIRDYVCLRASPQVNIEVRNPTYERILIRCSVAFKETLADGQEAALQGQGRGYLLGQLNQALLDFLSPWSNVGPPPRFGWSFQVEEVQAFVRRLDYVQLVTGFSMLHLTASDDGYYHLEDTGKPTWPDELELWEHQQSSPNWKIVPCYPWSLAIPNATNIIEVIDDRKSRDSQATGIGELAIGDVLTLRKRQ